MADPGKRRPPRSGAPRSASPRSAARLAAVQALYQVEITGVSGKVAAAEFVAHYLGREIDGDDYLPADETLFRALVSGTLAAQAELDPLIAGVLTTEWSFERLE